MAIVIENIIFNTVLLHYDIVSNVLISLYNWYKLVIKPLGFAAWLCPLPRSHLRVCQLAAKINYSGRCWSGYQSHTHWRLQLVSGVWSRVYIHCFVFLLHPDQTYTNAGSSMISCRDHRVECAKKEDYRTHAIKLNIMIDKHDKVPCITVDVFLTAFFFFCPSEMRTLPGLDSIEFRSGGTIIRY